MNKIADCKELKPAIPGIKKSCVQKEETKGKLQRVSLKPEAKCVSQDVILGLPLNLFQTILIKP